MDPSNFPSTSPYDGSARFVVLPSHPPPPYGSQQQIGGMTHVEYPKKMIPVNHGLNPYNFTPNDLNSSATVSSVVKTERTSSSASFSTSSSSPELMRGKRCKFYGTA